MIFHYIGITMALDGISVVGARISSNAAFSRVGGMNLAFTTT
jgi:hypothetical protein